MTMRKDAVSKKTTAKIEKLAEGVLKAVASGKNPFLDIPVRSLANAHNNAPCLGRHSRNQLAQRLHDLWSCVE